jgi:hypothetical protein
MARKPNTQKKVMIDEKAIQADFEQLFDACGGLLANLYDRWHYERDYEDFADYEQVIRDEISKYPKIVFLKATRSPFGVQVQHAQCPTLLARITVNSKSCKLQYKRLPQ